MKLKLAVFTLSLAALGYAQFGGRGPRGAAADGAPPAEAAKTYLALTDSQVTGFQAVRQTAQTGAQPLLEQVRTKQQALRAALNATNVDAAAVTALRAEIAALEVQLKTIRDNARAQMVALLGPDQKAKLATLEAASALHAEIAGAAGIGLLDGPGGPGFGPTGGRGKASKGNAGKGKGGPRAFGKARGFGPVA